MNNISINLSKQVFIQGETIKIKIRYNNENLPVKEGKISLCGTEKVEFSMQSFLGKKGFSPIWGMLFPTRHFTESTSFLDETYDINHSGGDSDEAEVEVPINAIPSYYGDNSKVSYTLKLECKNKNDQLIREEIEILVDRNYKSEQKKEAVDIFGGSIIFTYSEPLIINAVNFVNISSLNIQMKNPVRFYLVGEETVTASGVTVSNALKDLPLGQIFSEESIKNYSMEFKIPSKYQHGYDAIHSRLEYHIELRSVDFHTRLGIKREKMKNIDRFLVQVDEKKTPSLEMDSNL